MTDLSAARAAAHIYLDAVTAYDNDSGDDGANVAAMNVAFQRLADAGAIAVRVEARTGVRSVVDVTPLMAGVVVSMKWLVARATSHGRVSEEEVVADLRAFLDEALV
ncbi:hypothetical protein ACFQW6_19710 [Nocardioides sp. GCM10028917]|uniref:hypothetical protein n=1 Tax=Nocardioides sp. GCM10028917 TaxID=3273408 RepID=UPI003611E8A2